MTRLPSDVTRHVSRRKLLAGGAALCAVAGGAASAVALADDTAGTSLVYLGCYTAEPGSDGHGGGISLARFDSKTGVLSPPQLVARTKNPSWIALSPDRAFLFACNELEQFDGKPGGGISSFAIDRATGALTPRAAVASGGATPAHCSVTPSGKFLLVANYGGGSVAVLPIGADGSLGAPTSLVHNEGPRNPDRAQDNPPGNFAPSDHAGSHVHMVATDPTGTFVIADDAGLDRLYVWRLDDAGRLTPHAPPFLAAPPGAAPRHFAFSPDGRRFYNVLEQDSRLAVFDVAADAGFALRQTLSVLPVGFAGSNLAAEIVVARDGGHIYVSNRLHDTIAVLQDRDGAVRLLGEVATQADYPRGLALDPSGHWLLAGNQRADCVTIFQRDPASGMLRFSGRYVPTGSPTAIAFVD